MDIIRDPVTGTGMRVDDEGKGQVEAKIHPDAFEINHTHGRAFVMDLPKVALGDAWVWAVVKNINDDDLIIACVNLWAAEDKDDYNIEAYTRGAFAYSANGTAAVAAQLNGARALPGTSDLMLYYNDGGGDLATITSGQVAGKILARKVPQKLVVSGSWIIPKDQVFYLKAASAAGGSMTGSIEMYFHNG